MEIIAHYRRLADFDVWANNEALRSLREAGAGAPERALSLITHILATEHVWLARINTPDVKPPVWPEWTLEQVERQLEVVSQEWHAILNAGETRLMESVEYQNSKGERWLNNVGEVFMHVMMHGTYHRGQIATLLRQSGATPAYTDYIEAVRRGRI
jgi:uncharacterized damage-inducible protein DinB